MITKKDKEEQRRTKSDVDLLSSSGLASLSASPLGGSQEINVSLEEAKGKALASSIAIEQAPTPTLHRDMVQRALITFFDNGEKAKQRFKIAVRLNLKDEPSNESPEFIAPITKDGRAFRRYSAPNTRDDLIDFHNEKVGDRKLLPVPYGEGFSDKDILPVLNAKGLM